MTPDEAKKLMAKQDEEVKRILAETSSLAPSPAVSKAITQTEQIKGIAKAETE